MITTSKFKLFIPHLVLMIWLCCIVLAVSALIKKTEYPPTAEAFSYYQKAENFWSSMKPGGIANPFNIEPTIRPPATIAISYPTGFSFSYKNYYFRSIVVPMLCFVIACYIALFRFSRDVTEQINTALLAAVCASLPMFYQFEYNLNNPVTVHYLGYMDLYFAGIAALAVSFLIRGITDNSLKLITVSAFFSALTMGIKLTGMVVMGAILASLMICAVYIRFFKKSQFPENLYNKLTWGIVIHILLYAAIVYISLKSQYLTWDHISYNRNIAIILSESRGAYNLKDFLYMLHGSFNVALQLILIVYAIYYLIKKNRQPDLKQYRILFICFIFYISAGIWFWIVKTHVSVIRYFLPFYAMGLYSVIKVLYDGLNSKLVSKTVKIAVYTAVALHLANTTVLLASGSKPIRWQKWSGMNLASGTCKDEITAAGQFANNTINSNQRIRLYSLNQVSTGIGAFQSKFNYEMSKAKKGYILNNDDDVRMIKFSALLNSDYLLISKEMPSLPKLDSQLEREVRFYNTLFYNLAEKDGVKTVAETRSVRLIKLVDKRKLIRILYPTLYYDLSEKDGVLSGTLKKDKWRPAFIDANRPKSRQQDKREILLKEKKADLYNVLFENKFKIDVIKIMKKDGKLVVDLLWERLAPLDGEQYFLFIHCLDKDGNILMNGEIPLEIDYSTGIVSEQKENYGHAELSGIPEAVIKAGLGILSPGEQPSQYNLLNPNKGERDWDNKRIVLTIRKSE